MEGSQIMADQIYKVQDGQGNIREISGPAGASDEQIIAQAKALFAPAPTSKGESALRGAAQGVSLGFSDEISGLAPFAAELLKGNGLDAAKNAYTDTRDLERSANEAAQKSNPKTYLAGNVGGAIATAPLLPAAAGIAGSTKVGAGIGAATGLGNGQGDLESQAKSTALGALAGGTIGAAIPAVQTGISKAANTISEKARNMAGTDYLTNVVPAQQKKFVSDLTAARDAPIATGNQAFMLDRAIKNTQNKVNPETTTANLSPEAVAAKGRERLGEVGGYDELAQTVKDAGAQNPIKSALGSAVESIKDTASHPGKLSFPSIAGYLLGGHAGAVALPVAVAGTKATAAGTKSAMTNMGYESALYHAPTALESGAAKVGSIDTTQATLGFKPILDALEKDDSVHGGTPEAKVSFLNATDPAFRAKMRGEEEK